MREFSKVFGFRYCIQKPLQWTALSVVFFACQQSEDLNVSDHLGSDEEKRMEKLLTNEQLRQLALSMGGFINDKDVKEELLTYANEETGYEIDKPFSEILNKKGENARSAPSVFGSKLLKSLSNCSNCRAITTLDSIVDILSEEYSIYAPYLAEEHAESEEPVTISWWDGIDTTGTTPGIVTAGDESSANGRVAFGGFILVNDFYAYAHPTVVIMPKLYSGLNFLNSAHFSYSAKNNSTPPPRDIDCRELSEDVILEMQMPHFRLNGNTRWPGRNVLYMWTIAGEYSTNSNGTVSLTPGDNNIWGRRGKKVSRRDARKRHWVSSGVANIRSNWKRSQPEMRIIVAYRKGRRDFNFSGKIKVDTDGNFSADSEVSYSVGQRNAKTFFNVSFDRCSTLATIKSDEGQGVVNSGYRIYTYGKFSFYLKPVMR